MNYEVSILAITRAVDESAVSMPTIFTRLRTNGSANSKENTDVYTNVLSRSINLITSFRLLQV